MWKEASGAYLAVSAGWYQGESVGSSAEFRGRAQISGQLANSQPKTTRRDAKPFRPKGSNASATLQRRGYGESNPNAQGLKGGSGQAGNRPVPPFQGLIWGLGRRTWRPGALPQAIGSEPFRLSPLPRAACPD